MQTHGLLTLTASSSPLLYKKIVVHIHRRGYYTTNLSMFDVEPKISEKPSLTVSSVSQPLGTYFPGGLSLLLEGGLKTV